MEALRGLGEALSSSPRRSRLFQDTASLDATCSGVIIGAAGKQLPHIAVIVHDHCRHSHPAPSTTLHHHAQHGHCQYHPETAVQGMLVMSCITMLPYMQHVHTMYTCTQCAAAATDTRLRGQPQSPPRRGRLFRRELRRPRTQRATARLGAGDCGEATSKVQAVFLSRNRR